MKKVLLSLLCGVMLIGIITGCGNKENNNPTASSATFEQVGEYHVLKDDKGRILVDNIKNYGAFCNGSTIITSKDGQVGIINDKGKFIAEYGKYKFIEQIGCYYEVTNFEDEIIVKILNYDGSIFFQDEEDVYLKNSSIDCAVDFCFSKKVMLFETKDKYQLLDTKGNILIEYKKIKNADEPKIDGMKGNSEADRYISSYYNGKTDIIDTNSYNIITSLNGDYYIIDVNGNDENQAILYKNTDKNRHTIVLNNGKQTFESNTCLNVMFVNDEVRCLIKNGGHFEYYDINGKKIEK